MYQAAHKYQYIEDIYRQLSKKYSANLDIWTGYIEFLFQLRTYKQDKTSPQYALVANLDISDSKPVL